MARIATLSGVLLGCLAACGSGDRRSAARPSATSFETAPVVSGGASASPPPDYTTHVISLPGAGSEGVAMDFLLFDPDDDSVWVPAGNTGSVDVIDTATQSVRRVEGFATQELAGRGGKRRTVGPSSVTLGEGLVYVGNRGDFAICAIDPKTLEKKTCGPKLDSMPDGIAFVAPTREIWVTAPRDQSIRVLDAKTLAQKTRVPFDGQPEGYAVDAMRGRFYTNLEDKDLTLAVDLKTQKTLATWHSGCGNEGPHGLRLDEKNGILFIACSAKVESMDVAHDGAIVGSADTGDGVDDIDWVAATRLLYAGAGKAASLAILHADDRGELAVEAKVPTAEGARNAAADASGRVYLARSKASEIFVVTPAKK